MTKTADRTGVLIFLLLEDQKFHIFADDGIHKKVAEGTWQKIANEMARQFSGKKYKEGILDGVRTVAAELSRHFPHKAAGNDELPNTVHVG